jgi:hypothetical protein
VPIEVEHAEEATKLRDGPRRGGSPLDVLLVLSAVGNPRRITSGSPISGGKVSMCHWYSLDVVDGVVAHLPLNSYGVSEIQKLGEKRVN